MLYINTLEKLRKEFGICYFDLDQVNAAIKICDDINNNYQEEINSVMCFHNVILEELFKYNVISADDAILYYDKPTYLYVLDYLNSCINSYFENGNIKHKDEIKKIQKKLLILKGNLKKDEILVKKTKELYNFAKSSYKGELREIRKQRRALVYAKKRIKRKENN